MSLLGKIESFFTGVDIDAEQARSDAADAELARINDAAFERGRIDEPTYQATRLHIDEQHAASQDLSGQVAGAFGEGIQEGADNIRLGLGGAINKIIGTALRIVPWQVWALAAVGAVFYFWPVIRPVLSRLTNKAK